MNSQKKIQKGHHDQLSRSCHFPDISVGNFLSTVFPLNIAVPWESIFHSHWTLSLCGPSGAPQCLPIQTAQHLLDLLWRTAVGGRTVYPSICRCSALEGTQPHSELVRLELSALFAQQAITPGKTGWSFTGWVGALWKQSGHWIDTCVVVLLPLFSPSLPPFPPSSWPAHPASQKAKLNRRTNYLLRGRMWRSSVWGGS